MKAREVMNKTKNEKFVQWPVVCIDLSLALAYLNQILYTKTQIMLDINSVCSCTVPYYLYILLYQIRTKLHTFLTQIFPTFYPWLLLYHVTQIFICSISSSYLLECRAHDSASQQDLPSQTPLLPLQPQEQ